LSEVEGESAASQVGGESSSEVDNRESSEVESSEVEGESSAEVGGEWSAEADGESSAEVDGEPCPEVDGKSIAEVGETGLVGSAVLLVSWRIVVPASNNHLEPFASRIVWTSCDHSRGLGRTAGRLE
jgi:hypothetical protein